MASILNTLKDGVLNVVFGIEKTPQLTDSDIESYDENVLDEDGAPVEKKSPLGQTVTYLSSFYLIIQGVIGTGIFATPATVLESLGSVGASYVFWVVGFLVTLFQVFMYVEYVTYFRRRSGAEVVFLEQAFPNPKFFIPVLYAAVTIVLSFSTSSASAFATYIYKAAGYDASPWEIRGLGVASLALAAIMTSANTKVAMRINNVIGFAKVVFVLFIAFSGFAALAGTTKAPKDHSIFQNAWEGTTTDGNSISNAILKVVFSFGGTSYAFAVVAETHPKNTIKTYKYFVPFTLFFIFILYILCVTAYYAGIGNINEIKNSGNLIAAVYFQKIFETQSAVNAMCAFVALSAFGHLLTVYISHSRALRECGRQGVLPFPKIWTSVKPWGTPLFPIFVTFLVNLVVLLAPPPGDAYNFIVDMGSYSGYIFDVFLAIGLFKLRRDRKKLGLGYREFHIPTFLMVIVLLWSLFVIIMAFVPPKGTLIGSDVSFFYAAYPITTIGLFVLCGFYYVVWKILLPKIGGYQHRVEYYQLESGESGHKVIKVSNSELEEWDRQHKGSQTIIGNGKFDDEPVSGEIDFIQTASDNDSNDNSEIEIHRVNLGDESGEKKGI